MEEFIFETLDVWKKSRSLVAEIYKIQETFPQFERYALCDQMRRAAVSVPSNIAEGSGRVSVKEKIHFLEIAYGSLMETFSQLSVAIELKYVSKDIVDNLRPRFVEVAKMLSGWRSSLKQKLEAQ